MNKNKKLNYKKILKIGAKVGATALVLLGQAGIVFGATDDPLSVINNLKDFMFQIISAIGVILLLWGIVQIGMAIKSHDPSQRANRIHDFGRWSNYCICKTNTRVNYGVKIKKNKNGVILFNIKIKEENNIVR